MDFRKGQKAMLTVEVTLDEDTWPYNQFPYVLIDGSKLASTGDGRYVALARDLTPAPMTFQKGDIIHKATGVGRRSDGVWYFAGMKYDYPDTYVEDCINNLGWTLLPDPDAKD